MQWTSDADTSTSEQVVSKLNSAMATVAGKQNLLLPFLYQNDAGYFQNPLLGIGASRLAEMKITSNMYDPSQIFQRLQNDGFLLSR